MEFLIGQVQLSEMKKWILCILLTCLLGCSKRGASVEIRAEEIDRLWSHLIQINGCLVGRQYERPLLWFLKVEGCVLHEHPDWKLFFSYPKKELTQFLVTRLDKTNETQTHTCPFYNATEGELAIYSLQVVHNKNWYDFPPFHTYRERVYLQP